MLQRSVRRLLGFTAVNPDTSPMQMYNQYNWHYNLPQTMEPPRSVNRTLPAPFQSHYASVNRYRGVWIDTDMHPAFLTALEPQLRKLPHGRVVPPTPVDEVIAEYDAMAPRIDDARARDGWLAKVLQHCAFQRRGDEAMALWQRYCAPRFMPPTSTHHGDNDSSGGGDTRGAAVAAVGDGRVACKPPLPLVQAMLFCCSKCDLASWRDIFTRCLKDGWNYTPLFELSQWSSLLKSVGRQGDEHGVELLLREMLDVQVDLDRLEARSIVVALNAVHDAAVYNYVKRYLFHFGERKVTLLQKVYTTLRGHGAATLRVPLAPNDAMYYHVCWHATVRQPRQFSPRQLYFDYKPSRLGGSAHDVNAKIDDIVKDKIEKWKAEGMLPEDYVHEDRVYDRGAAFKNVARLERWKKIPKIVRDKRYGYSGDA